MQTAAREIHPASLARLEIERVVPIQIDARHEALQLAVRNVSTLAPQAWSMVRVVCVGWGGCSGLSQTHLNCSR
jgi:hypothetical protein